MSLTIEYNGIKVLKPSGRVGVTHFGLMTQYLKIIKEYHDTGRNTEDLLFDERVLDIFEKWVEKVLPKIVIGDTDPDKIPFDTLWVLFNKVMNSVEVPDEESFR